MDYRMNNGIYEKMKSQRIQRMYNVKDNVINILNNNNIFTLGDLSNKKTTELREYGLESKEIRGVERELELLGLRLKNSH